jgi:hypothetical protein
MSTSAVIAAIIATSSVGAPIREELAEKQNAVFQRYWGTDFVWEFDQLPAKGKVPDYRVPYSGYIYPDSGGGTVHALGKYDRAFNTGRNSAAAHERWDTTAFREPVRRRFGLFRSRMVMGTPHWYGHCNGWTAASIRHAEPRKSVERNGVTFSPADIKALLAEIYMYNDNENLAGLDYVINAGTFHAVIANWLGRGSHPVGMEADPGREKWNYPIYAYSISASEYSDRLVNVRMSMSYAKDSRGEYQQSPRIEYKKYFSYALELDENGRIVGGYFHRGSSMIDLLWVPLRPKQGGKKGNERGNPYVDVDKVLAIWRDSVAKDTRTKWAVADPPRLDRFVKLASYEGLEPVHDVAAKENEAADAAVATADAEDAGSEGSGVVTADYEERGTDAAE